MASLSAKLTFLLTERDVPWIGRESGIPWANIRSVIAGTSQFTTGEARRIRNTYQRESYSRLREAGMPAHQARRFSWFAPSSVEPKIETVKTAIADLAAGLTTQRTHKLDLEGMYYDAEDVYADAWEDVWKGFSTTPTTYEDWETSAERERH